MVVRQVVRQSRGLPAIFEAVGNIGSLALFNQRFLCPSTKVYPPEEETSGG